MGLGAEVDSKLAGGRLDDFFLRAARFDGNLVFMHGVIIACLV